MLSGITNYFFGGFFKSDEVPQLAADDSTNMTLTLEDDGEWMIVNSGSDVPTTKGECEERRPSVKRAEVNVLSPTRKPLEIRRDNSWYITPPSCFTSEQTSRKRLQAMTISPMENLLIERPMSTFLDYIMKKTDMEIDMEINMEMFDEFDERLVFGYWRKEMKCKERKEKPKKKVHGTIQEKRLQMIRDAKPQSNVINVNDGCIHKKLNQVIRNLELEAIDQKLIQRYQTKFMTMKQFERQNKIQDYQSKRQKQRRKDHSHRPSGRSNDRKC
ncbi:hypothetical protein CHUAL_009108 [Chamberlinius hualienensis]